LKYLKSFGYGSRIMEEHITKECNEIINILLKAEEPILANSIFDVAIINIVWRLVAGKR
jgi:hypothetical protein